MFYLFQDIKQTGINNFEKIFASLFILLPLTLVTGPFLSDLSISLIALFFIYSSFKNGLWKYYHNYFVYIFLYFYTSIIISSLISSNIFFSLSSSFFYFRFLFFVMGAAYLIKKNPFIIKYFFVALVSIIVILSIDAYIQFTFGKNIFGFPIIGKRVSGLFGDELVLGRYLSHLMPILFALISIISFKKIERKFVYMFLLLLLVSIDILIFISGGRTALFNLTLATIIIIIFTSNLKFLRTLTFFISVIFMVLISIFANDTKERIFDDTVSQITSKSDSFYYLSIEHEGVFITAYRMFTDKFLFGHGPNTFRIECKNELYNVPMYGCSTHPHNTYIQLLSETGVLGTIPIIAGLIITIFILSQQLYYLLAHKKEKRFTDYRICLIACIAIIIWPISPSLNFFNNWISILYFLPICFIMLDEKDIQLR